MDEIKSVLVTVLLLASVSTAAQQRLEMQGTSVIGNKELPKVLYIVPWKAAQRIDLTTPAYSSVLDQPFQPLERTGFRRQLQYYDALYAAPVQHEGNP